MSEAPYSVQRLGNVVFLHWKDAIVSSGALALDCEMKAAAEGSRRIGLYTLANAKTALHAPVDARQAVSRCLDRHGPRVGAAAVLVYGNNPLGVTLAQSIITGINLVMRNSFPNKVFSDVNASLAWFCPTLEMPSETRIWLRNSVRLSIPASPTLFA